MHAEQVRLVSIPIAAATPVNADTPVTVLVAVALSAEPVGLGEIDQLAARQMQLVTVRGGVAVETPPMLFIVMQDDLFVCRRERPPLGVHLDLGVVALGTRKSPLGERG